MSSILYAENRQRELLKKNFLFCQGRVFLGRREKGATDFTVRRDCGNHYSLSWCLYSNTVRYTTPACIFDVALPSLVLVSSTAHVYYFFGESLYSTCYLYRHNIIFKYKRLVLDEMLQWKYVQSNFEAFQYRFSLLIHPNLDITKQIAI